MIVEEEIKIIGFDKSKVSQSTIDYLLENHKAYSDTNPNMGEHLFQIEEAYDAIRVKKFHQTKMGADKYADMLIAKQDITTLFAVAAGRGASYIRFV